MAEKTKLRITQEAGDLLLKFSAGFIAPEKLGETAFNVADRSLAERDTALLYRELKCRSGLLVSKRKLLFGPAENWEKTGGENGQERWNLRNPSLEVEITLDDDTRSGVYWCLLLMLHPGSGVRISASTQEDIVWPLAEKFRIKGELEKAIGLDRAVPRRLALDAPSLEVGGTGIKDKEAP